VNNYEKIFPVEGKKARQFASIAYCVCIYLPSSCHLLYTQPMLRIQLFMHRCHCPFCTEAFFLFF